VVIFDFQVANPCRVQALRRPMSRLRHGVGTRELDGIAESGECPPKRMSVEECDAEADVRGCRILGWRRSDVGDASCPGLRPHYYCDRSANGGARMGVAHEEESSGAHIPGPQRDEAAPCFTGDEHLNLPGEAGLSADEVTLTAHEPHLRVHRLFLCLPLV